MLWIWDKFWVVLHVHLPSLMLWKFFTSKSPDMAIKYIGAVAGSLAIAYLLDMAIAEKKIFGGRRNNSM